MILHVSVVIRSEIGLPGHRRHLVRRNGSILPVS